MNNFLIQKVFFSIHLILYVILSLSPIPYEQKCEKNFFGLLTSMIMVIGFWFNKVQSGNILLLNVNKKLACSISYQIGRSNLFRTLVISKKSSGKIKGFERHQWKFRNTFFIAVLLIRAFSGFLADLSTNFLKSLYLREVKEQWALIRKLVLLN